MIIVDEGADGKLAQALESLRSDPGSARCIYLSLKNSTPVAGLKEKVIETAKRELESSYPQLYFCEDGDIVVLASVLPRRNANLFMTDIAVFLNRPAGEEWIGFWELAIHMNKLLVVVEEKLDNRRKREEIAKKQAEKEQIERKRRAILNGAKTVSGEDIKARRARRNTPELMIIEDDAFSRRLVENVLQKKYPLTGIGEASHALDTYARLAPDLLFLDINLPDVTGHELLEKIIALDPEAYVVMLSGNADQMNITKALSIGAKGFVAKPFNREKIFQYLDRCPNIAEKQHSIAMN